MVKLGIGFIVCAVLIEIGLAFEKFHGGYSSSGSSDTTRRGSLIFSAFLTCVLAAATMTNFCGVFSGFVQRFISKKRACSDGASVEGRNSVAKRRRTCGAGGSAAASASEIKGCVGGSDGGRNREAVEDRGRSFSMSHHGESAQEIDEDLHSRQRAVYGRDTMRRMFASNVLISGMQGLGAEIGMLFAY